MKPSNLKERLAFVKQIESVIPLVQIVTNDIAE